MLKLDSMKVASLMETQALNVTQLARRCFLPPETVRRALNGRFVDAMDAYKIGDALGVKVEELQAGIRHFAHEIEGVDSAIATVTEALVALCNDKDAARSFCRDLVILGALKQRH